MSEEIVKEVTEEVTEETEETAAEANSVWAGFEEKMKANTVITVEIAGVVKSGVVAYIDGVRGFIPASQLSTEYVEDLESWLGKMVDVMIIEAKEDEKRLILSGKKVARKEERKKKFESITVGSVLEGTVESLQPYGAFIDLGDKISGLVHISQISTKRIKTPEDVLAVGDKVTVKVLSNEKRKISLSMRAVLEDAKKEEEAAAPKEETFHYKEKGKASTNLGDLLKDIQL
ncbi:MAG: S1 RNA-binding domain-containing protein [Lachnospiraceae bacterium]|nr:S1 RNA-binding domain-containing protein [Lachnospiraceae bacterium]